MFSYFCYFPRPRGRSVPVQMAATVMTSEEAAHFEECYDAFAARERAIQTFSDWTTAKFHDAVTTKLAFDGLKDEKNCSKQLRVLGIGSGSGKVLYVNNVSVTTMHRDIA